MGIPAGQRPEGVGAYARGQQPERAPEDHVTPLEDTGGLPGRGLSHVGLALLVVAVVLIVIASVIGILALVVVVQYPQHQTLSLNSRNGWNGEVSIPVPMDGSAVNVRFNWTASDHSMVRLQAIPWGQPTFYSPVYNVTATAGSGWYLSTSTTCVMGFVAVGTPTLPPFVNITLSYDMSGHYLGGPGSGTGC
jgi:hypothetical protein